MKINCNSFFNGEFVEIELNSIAKKYNIPANKPWLMQNYLNKFRELTGLNTFGGYGEDRRHMWKGTYIEETKKYYHLGIDINIPEGTLIKYPFDCILVHISVDKDNEIGWGGRLILFRNYNLPLLVLGHLNPKRLILDNLWNVNKKQGEILGRVGTWPTNGNVFQHLHIQCIKSKNIRDFDGYGFKEDLKNNPNPFEIEW